MIKKIVLILFFILVMLLGYFFVYLRPSNTRNWELGFAKLPHIVETNDTTTIYNFRDYRYKPGKQIGYNYTTRVIKNDDIQRVWFVFEPFPLKSLPDFGGVAHTYFVFDIKNEDPVALSVEARREKGETYDAFLGLINQFELIYVWASERDITGRRVLIDTNDLYMYPVQISKEDAKKLFLASIDTTKQLETTPRFYNSMTSNCTNELAKNANEIHPGSIPLNIALFFPGYADKILYQYKFIPHDKPIEQIKKEYYISDLVMKYAQEKDFSPLIRKSIPR